MYDNLSPIPLDPNCTACPLTCGTSIAGRGPDDLSQVKLILVSDYPGAYESEYGWPQVPNYWVHAQQERKRKLPPPPNSGAFIRDLIASEFGVDTFTQMWTTNALKCDPNSKGRKLTTTARQLGICTSQWGQAEFATLDRYCPHVPILAAGSWALKLVKLIYQHSCPDGSVNDLLRGKSLYAGTHPLVVSYNPATYARSYSQIETGITVSRRSKLIEITSLQPLSDYLFTPTEIFKADLAELRQYLAVS